MKLTEEQLAKWAALVPELNNDADDHMDVAHSADMAPQHTVNFRHAKNAHEAARAIPALIADLEEAQSDRETSELRNKAFRHHLVVRDTELAKTRKQLTEAQALFFKISEDTPCKCKEHSKQAEEFLKRTGHKALDSILDAAIAEAIEPYRKDAERFQELLSRVGDDSGLTIVKIEGWSDEYPGYAWFADLSQEQVIAELDAAIAAKGESNAKTI